jgi:hypothetical protein
VIIQDLKMKIFMFASTLAFGALFGAPAQAAPVSADAAAVQGQVKGDAVKVWHCRTYSGGWGCGGEHRRYWSHRRHGSRGY